MTGIKFISKGFTLVEMVVVMAVFLFIIGAGATVFISVMEHQGNILQEQKVLNQISYVEEYMSKALRMAKRATATDTSCIPENYIYQLTRPDTIESGYYAGIKFINQTDGDACQEFFVDYAVHGDASTPLVLKQLKNSTDVGDAIALTSDNTIIDYIRFGINGKNGCYGAEAFCPSGAFKSQIFQPRVTILLNVQIKGSTQNSSRIFQTTVSQRNLNAQ